MPDARHITPCSCIGSCAVAVFTEWEGDAARPDEWFVEFYEHICRVPRWRDRLRVAWGVLRGREPYTHGLCLQAEEIVALRDFLDERTGGSAELARNAVGWQGRALKAEAKLEEMGR